MAQEINDSNALGAKTTSLTWWMDIARTFQPSPGPRSNLSSLLPSPQLLYAIDGHKSETCWANVHANGSKLDSSTITARAKEMKTKRFSKKNKIDIASMSRDDREQLMANLTIAELENKGKIGNCLLYYPGSLAWDVDNISLVRRVF